MSINKLIAYLGLFFMALAIVSCGKDGQNKVHFESKVNSTQDLKEHSEEFEEQIIKVSDNIYVAIGFGLANSILIEGTDGVVIVDCMESTNTATKVKAAFAKITDKPVVAIIYTHFHPDHTFGAKTMAGSDNPKIYAHETTQLHIEKLVNVIRPIITKRSYRMFGNLLDEDALVNAGIGPFLKLDEEVSWGVLKPTHVFDKELNIEEAGIKMKLVHAPGETDDQLFVWLENKKILLSGDNIYKTFPNLYTIRGTSYRDIKKWSASIDKMRYLNPEIVIPSHTKPITDKDSVQTILTDYRDAIQFVHDQTIRNINLGLMPDEIAEKITLPEHLAKSPYLQEFYGKVNWSVKSVFNGYLGFFDGNPSTLLPLAVKDKAEKMAELVGGHTALSDKATHAFNDKEYQWALELTDYLLQLNKDDQKAKTLRYDCLIKLGETNSNPNARHYYLTSALELKGLEIKNQPATAEVAKQLTLKSIFDGMSVNLIPEKSLDQNKKVNFYFPDVEEYWSVQVRQGVAEIQAFKIEGADIEIEMESENWKRLAAGVDGGLGSYFSGKIDFKKGTLLAFKSFFDMFKN
ncbi:alkyl sulfatase dimerization domain-containing protein [Olleya sp. R77988]|uniref:alkyl sulfatase dimerization domain-containing protein n=1 Tax=Olleya sp. R77988 TaxID=3093875 RepID=UPI0037C8F528